MRLPVAVLLILLALPAAAAEPEWRLVGSSPNFAIGTALAPGLAGSQAAFVSGNDKARNWQHGVMEQRIAPESWRGQRVRLTLRLKNDDGARVRASLRLVRPNDVTFATNAQWNAPGSDAWESHSIVMDVPADTTMLALRVSTQGKGTGWIEGVRTEIVGADVPVSPSRGGRSPSIFNTALDGSFGN